MSQLQSCLQEKLRKKLEAVKSEEPGTDWLRAVLVRRMAAVPEGILREG